MSESNGRYVYFLYSATQRKQRKDIESTVNPAGYRPKKVLVNGKWKEFTEMNTTGENRYSDAVIVAEGYYSLMKIS